MVLAEGALGYSGPEFKSCPLHVTLSKLHFPPGGQSPNPQSGDVLHLPCRLLGELHVNSYF